MRTLSKLSLWLFAAFLTIQVTACKKDSKTEESPKLVKLQTSPSLGTYLTDKDGRALYYFSNDFNGMNNCQGNCAKVWPLYYVDGLTAGNLGEGLSINDFATIVTPDNQKQLTYKSWPLYYYAPSVNGTNVQEGSGTTTGEAVNGVWFVAKPDYTVMLVNAQLVGHDGKNYKSDYTEGTGKTLYFSDAMGKTLYAFKNDKANKNNFTNSTFSNNTVWPIYEMEQIVVPSTLDKSLFSITNVFGKKQLSYKGWPLYYFGQDAGVRGANKGISFPSPGVWPVAVKDAAAAPPQ